MSNHSCSEVHWFGILVAEVCGDEPIMDNKVSTFTWWVASIWNAPPNSSASIVCVFLRWQFIPMTLKHLKEIQKSWVPNFLLQKKRVFHPVFLKCLSVSCRGKNLRTLFSWQIPHTLWFLVARAGRCLAGCFCIAGRSWWCEHRNECCLMEGHVRGGWIQEIMCKILMKDAERKFTHTVYMFRGIVDEWLVLVNKNAKNKNCFYLRTVFIVVGRWFAIFCWMFYLWHFLHFPTIVLLCCYMLLSWSFVFKVVFSSKPVTTSARIFGAPLQLSP